MNDQQDEREYPREDTDTRPLAQRPFIGRWPNPLWAGLPPDEEDEP